MTDGPLSGANLDDYLKHMILGQYHPDILAASGGCTSSPVVKKENTADLTALAVNFRSLQVEPSPPPLIMKTTRIEVTSESESIMEVGICALTEDDNVSLEEDGSLYMRDYRS